MHAYKASHKHQGNETKNKNDRKASLVDANYSHDIGVC